MFNIGSDQPVSILELAQRVIAVVDPKLDVEFQSYARPIPTISRMSAAGARPVEAAAHDRLAARIRPRRDRAGRGGVENGGGRKGGGGDAENR